MRLKWQSQNDSHQTLHDGKQQFFRRKASVPFMLMTISKKYKNVDFLECYSPLPEDQAGEKEGERTEGYGRGTTSWFCLLNFAT